MQLSNLPPDLFTYNILIDGYCKNGCVLEAVELFHTLINRNIQPDITTFNCLINGLCKTGRLNIAWEMFNRLHSNGFVPDVITYTIIMHGFCKEGKLEIASKCFSDMEQNGVAPDLLTFNTLMSGFLQNNETLKVVELLHKMKERNVKPDASIGSIILDLLGKHEDYREENTDKDARKVVDGFAPKATDQNDAIEKWNLYFFGEMNPLDEVCSKKLVVADAKLNLDDDAAFLVEGNLSCDPSQEGP
ncbi:putative pentatricopeptide repeat-containing protein At1g09680 [Mangifera indica]|uniref:putative pentatricopeptide repeat-containing protein At1g09680 n=1 Tax=Mangifera indica TaxID=29780 RepID=UPI001CFAF5F0|nr:putative pentatricopeptide repeat-containing protein At1g09680 [Mangifera indica]